MLTCSKRMPQGKGLAKALIQRAPTLTLDWDLRQKSRFEATDSAGRSLGVVLPRGTVLRGGDVLVVEDGSLVRVVAASQRLMRITATGDDAAFALMRAAYHLGNRHVPIELQRAHLCIEPDHVLAEMLHAMALTVTEVDAPFEPEGGAYGDSALLSHAHAHAHEHAHNHGHHDHGHTHGPDCGHAH